MHGRHGAGARRDAGGDMERRAVSATMQHAPGVPAGWSIECCWAERRREQGTTGRLHLRGVRASSCRQVVSRAAHFCATPGRHVGDGHGARLVGPPRRVRLRSTSARACGLSARACGRRFIAGGVASALAVTAFHAGVRALPSAAPRFSRLPRCWIARVTHAGRHANESRHSMGICRH